MNEEKWTIILFVALLLIAMLTATLLISGFGTFLVLAIYIVIMMMILNVFHNLME